MHIYKKLILGLSLVLAFSLTLPSILNPTKHAQAAGIVGFTAQELQAASGKSACYFTDAQTIKCDIDHLGATQTITFTGPTGSPQVNNTYPYTNTDGSFCQPGRPIATGYAGASALKVQFTSTNPIAASIVATAIDTSHSQLWPGTNAQDCGTANVLGQVSPVLFKQSSVTLQNNTPGGPGSQYTAAAIKAARFSFTQNGGLITMVLADGTKTVFADKQPYDTTYNFVSPSVFCNGNNGTTSGSITLSSITGGTISGTLKIGYFNGSKCVGNSSPVNPISVTNSSLTLSDGTSSPLSQVVLQWNNISIEALTCSPSSGSCSADFSMALQQNSNGLNYLQSPSSACGGYTLLLSKVGGVTSKSGGFYDNSTNAPCGKSGVRTVAILGKQGTVITPPGGSCDPNTDPTCNSSGGNCTTGSDCGDTCALSSGGFSLAWVMCPLLAAADSVMVNLTNAIESQLSFTIQNNTGNATQQDQVKSAWALIKNIASVLLVVLMLVVVLSQAISIGPFDAYTLRKALPRLVIAVIALQISWPLLSWVVQLGDDLGRGIADLMYAPFGGRDAMSLGAVLSRDGIGAVAAGTISWIGVLGIAAVAAVSLPMILLLAWSAVMALLIVFFVLIFRKILIIFCLILAPLALLMWILPGTQRYWKLWHETFTKLLLMFPLIVGIIAAGRIFGYVAGSQGDELIRFLMIIIGFFGPLFILPKTFSWGGQALGAIGGAVGKAGQGLGKPVTGLLEDSKARSRWTQSRVARKNELNRMATLGQAEGLQAGGFRGRLNRGRLAGFRPGRPEILGGAGIRSAEGRLRERVSETALEGLEQDMVHKVQRENVEHVSNYLATGGDATAAISRIDAQRASLGLDPTNATEQAEIRTNFHRFDTNGWSGNRSFAAAAVQATGQAGALDAGAESAAQNIYTQGLGGRQRDEATARFGAIRFRAHTAARSAGQFASDSDSLGGAPGNASAEWRRVQDLPRVSFSSIPNVMGGTRPDTGWAHSASGQVADTASGVATAGSGHHVEGLTGPLADYSYVTSSGTTATYQGLRFEDQETQRFMNEMARVIANPTSFDARQTEQFNREYQGIIARLNSAHAGAGDTFRQTVEVKAAHKHFAG